MKNTKERTMAIRFIQAGLIILAILCMACGNIQPQYLPAVSNQLYQANQMYQQQEADKRHRQMHEQGIPHSHGGHYGHHHH